MCQTQHLSTSNLIRNDDLNDLNSHLHKNTKSWSEATVKSQCEAKCAEEHDCAGYDLMVGAPLVENGPTIYHCNLMRDTVCQSRDVKMFKRVESAS